MAIAIGLIVGLFLLLGFHLLGAGLRNPRWLILVVCLVLALYVYGQNQLETKSQNITVSARYSPACEPEHVEVTITNNGIKAITYLRFNVRGFRPNYSAYVAQRYHSTDRIIRPGHSWTSCWRVLQLDDVPVAQQVSLRWETTINSIELSE